jgi:hypothetical protein
VATVALAAVKAPAMTGIQKESKQMEFTKSEAEQWAKKHYKGLCGTLCPSFTPDLKESI